MAVLTSFIFITTWLLFLCSLSSSSEVYGSNHGGVATRSYRVTRMSSTLQATAEACSPHTSPQGDDLSSTSSLKIFHKHGPCSSLHLLNKTLQSQQKTKSSEQILLEDQFFLQDQTRVNHIQSLLSKDINKSKQLQKRKSQATSLPAFIGIPLGTANYYVTVGFGTPKMDSSLVFDTGSDFTWIQCKPCVVSCYQQKQPIFDPAQSTSYSNVSCNSVECTQLLRPATSITPRCSSSACIYGIQYGDQSSSLGFFGREKLTLTSKEVFPNFLFGCGENNNGLFVGFAGILGLGRNKLSLISQTAKKYGQVFSYCLPATLESAGFLTFGKEKLTSSTKFTPLLTDPKDPSFYFLDLMSIGVGGTKLPIPTSVFNSSGTLIDSGTVISRLPPSAYSPLKSSFRSLMSQYNLTQPTRLFDTCYNLTGYDTIDIPKVILYFKGGVEIDVDPSGILLGKASQTCLAFAANLDDGDVTILGNRQQQTYKIVHDVARKRLGFSPGGCR